MVSQIIKKNAQTEDKKFKGAQFKVTKHQKLTPLSVKEHLRDPFLQLVFLNQVSIFVNFLSKPIKDQGNTIKLDRSELNNLNVLQEQVYGCMAQIDNGVEKESCK